MHLPPFSNASIFTVLTPTFQYIDPPPPPHLQIRGTALDCMVMKLYTSRHEQMLTICIASLLFCIIRLFNGQSCSLQGIDLELHTTALAMLSILRWCGQLRNI